MAELMTRIQLKYDTLANWNASTFKLKAGELAIVTLGEAKDGTTAGTANQHPVLFKVGTGNHTFSELPYASALAADVYAWAKAADVTLEGKKIIFKDGAGATVKSVELNYLTQTEIEALIKAEADRAKEIEQGLRTDVDALKGTVGGAESGLVKDVADLKAAVGENGSVAEAITSAIETLDSNASQTAGADGLALSATIVDGKITAITGSIAAETYDAHGAAGLVQDNLDDYITTNNEAVNKKADKETTYTKTDVDGLIAPLATTEALNGVKATAEQGVADAKAAKDVADAAKARIDTFLDTEGVADTVDSLHDIKAWMEGEGVNATELTEAIAAEAKAREDGDALKVDKTAYDEHITAQNTRDGGQDEKIAALEAKPGLDKVGTVTEVVAGDGLTGGVAANGATGTIALNDATKASLAKADSALQAAALDNYYTKEEANGAFMDADETSSAIDAKIEALKLADNYASKAQGDKADTALQTVEVGAGLTVSAKADNKQTISIDENFVFVFNCGSATENID